LNISYPKISIITPSFNQGKFIEQTILSIVNQGYPNLEYIIIDGGSTDNTLDIIKKYSDRISYWISEPDNGQSDAIRKGLLKCTGEIFNWINSDDFLAPYSLFDIASAFENDIDIYCGFSQIFRDTDGITLFNHRTELFPELEETIVNQKINQPAMFYKLSIIHLLGGINQSLHYIMDLELWWRYLSKYGQNRIKLGETILTNFRLHEESKTVSSNAEFRSEESTVFLHMYTLLGTNSAIVKYFRNNGKYFSYNWDVCAITMNALNNNIAEMYIYKAYNIGDIQFCKFAFKQLLFNNRLNFSFHSFALFVKIYIGNLSFRKYFLRNA
jgi:glycosyltransferase involved in cell wall biosynthesis